MSSPEPGSGFTQIRAILLWIGALIVSITDLLNTLELARNRAPAALVKEQPPQLDPQSVLKMTLQETCSFS
jgi:hypothetical protein